VLAVPVSIDEEVGEFGLLIVEVTEPRVATMGLAEVDPVGFDAASGAGGLADVGLPGDVERMIEISLEIVSGLARSSFQGLSCG